MTEPDKIAEALRLQDEGRSQRVVARAIGKPRHWVRYQLARETANGDGPPAAPLGGVLSRYDTACRALAAAKRVDEVMVIRDEMEHLKLYGRQVKDRALIADATEIQLRAERRLGELLLAAEVAGLIKPGRPRKEDENPSDSERFSRVRLAEAGIDYKLSSKAQKTASIPERDFETMVAGMRERLASGRATIIDPGALLREDERERRRTAHAARTLEGGTVADLHALAASGFKASAILADPPWQFITRSERGEGRSANQHYRTDRLDRIKAHPVARLAAHDATLFMWTVDWCPAAALELIAAWGFEHKTTAFTWAKQNESGEGWHMGQGYWTRANPEVCWLATRGNPKRLYADVHQLVVAPVMEHSRKPDEIYDRIERLVEGPYVELYARREREGWLSWGDELAFRMPELPQARDTAAPGGGGSSG